MLKQAQTVAEKIKIFNCLDVIGFFNSFRLKFPHIIQPPLLYLYAAGGRSDKGRDPLDRERCIIEVVETTIVCLGCIYYSYFIIIIITSISG